jgi:polyphosphate kinase 2 (PPK2 family)
VTREAIRRVQIAREIGIVQEQLNRQQDRNAQMALLTNVLNTSVAQEKQSRLTLNSIAPGEKVIIIQSEADASGKGATADQIVLPNGETVDTIEQLHSGSNPKKWFDYFFRNL